MTSQTPAAFTLTMPARAENLAIVRQAITGLCESLRFESRKTADVKLATTEACTNAVLHAYPDGEGVMVVQAWVAERGLRMLVGDRGTGITPRIDSPGLGLGLPLVAALASQVLVREPDGGGTEVVMTFTFDEPQLSQ